MTNDIESLKKIALLIDADNTQRSKLELVLQEISTHGRIVIKRAYGNWQKECFKCWSKDIKDLAIKPVQQFDYVSGKNATDMALVIDAMELLHEDRYDAFAIVSSDSDFTPLALKIRESGLFVFGVGKKTTPVSFRNSCDEFIFLENLLTPEEEMKKEQEEKAKAENIQKKQNLALKIEELGFTPRTTELLKNAGIKTFEDLCKKGEKGIKSIKNVGKKTLKDITESLNKKGLELSENEGEDIEEIHKLLRLAYTTYQGDDEYVELSTVGSYLKRAKPDFDPRSYGYRKLYELIEAFPKRYKLVKKTLSSGTFSYSYKCLVPTGFLFVPDDISEIMENPDLYGPY